MRTLDRSYGKFTHSLLFIFITLLFLISYCIDFRGFNGTDDLHYAMLAARMLQGKYQPFVSVDLQSGRVLLVALQAVIYRLAGISDWSTQAGTLLCIVGCCWLTIFQVTEARTKGTVIAGAAIFYFNPVTKEAVTGIMPDAYVMLLMMLLYFCLRTTWREPVTRAKTTGLAVPAALICVASLYVKEVAIVFVPCVVAVALLCAGRRGLGFTAVFTLTFFAIITCLGLLYKQYTGDFFFKWTQIDVSQQMIIRMKPKENRFPDVAQMLVRLTYGPWLIFVKGGFYPVLLATAVLLFKAKRLKVSLSRLTPGVTLVVLLVVSLYFPFGLHAYVPLAPFPRHFLFLLPFATAVVMEEIGANGLAVHRHLLLPLLCLAGCLLIPLLSPGKWLWLTYGFLFVGFSALSWFTRPRRGYGSSGGKNEMEKKETMPALFGATLLAVLLCITTMDNVFLHRKKWYFDLRSLEQSLPGVAGYFPDHDNFMHWRLFRQFNDSGLCNLGRAPLPAFAHYYPRCDGFTPGWLIVNEVYTERSAGFVQTLAAMGSSGFLRRQMRSGGVVAYQLSEKNQWDSVRILLRKEP